MNRLKVVMISDLLIGFVIWLIDVWLVVLIVSSV